MKQSLLEQIFILEEKDDLHLMRLLILVYTISGSKKNGKINSISKLAKLDFFLRYPSALERALLYLERDKDLKKLDIKANEKISIETDLMHFQFGPWDNRYRRFLAILEAKRLIKMEVNKSTVEISITSTGRQLVETNISNKEFEDYYNRSKLIKINFNRLSPKALTEFYYTAFPEMLTMNPGEKIII